MMRRPKRTAPSNACVRFSTPSSQVYCFKLFSFELYYMKDLAPFDA